MLPEIEGEYELLFLTDSHVVVESGSGAERGTSATGSGNAAEGVSVAEGGNEARFAELSRKRYPQFADEKGRHSRENFEDWRVCQ